jgi:hypothetical protein
MRDSNIANATKESAQVAFPHGLLDFWTLLRPVAAMPPSFGSHCMQM